MIGFLLGKIGLEAGMKTGGRLLGLIIIAGLLATAGLGFWRGMAAIERMVTEARTEGANARDFVWKLQLATANAEAKDEQARQAQAAAASSAAAERTIGDLQKALNEWEARHAAQPGNPATCLGPDDLRELNRLRGRAGSP